MVYFDGCSLVYIVSHIFAMNVTCSFFFAFVILLSKLLTKWSHVANIAKMTQKKRTARKAIVEKGQLQLCCVCNTVKIRKLAKGPFLRSLYLEVLIYAGTFVFPYRLG